MKPSNTPSRPALARDPRPLGLQRGAGQPGPCEPAPPDGRRGSRPRPAPQRGRAGSSDGGEDAAPRERAEPLTRKPRGGRRAPRGAGSARGARPLPGASASLPRAGGLSAAPARGSPPAAGPPPRRGGSRTHAGAPARGSPPACRGARRAPGRPATRASTGGRRGAGPAVSAEDLHPGADAFVPLTAPLHGSERRESPRPAPACDQLRSHAEVLMTLKVGAAPGGRARGPSAAGSSPPLAPGDTPPRAQLTSARAAPRAPGPVPSPAPTRGACGACPSPRPRSGLERGRRAGRRSRTSKVTTVLYPPRRTSRAARPPLARTGRAARPAPRGAERRLAPLADAGTPPLRRGAPTRARRPRALGGRAGGGRARGAARGDRLQRRLRHRRRRPGQPPPREPVGRRRPQPARRTAPRFGGSCARTRRGWGRPGSKQGAGWGSHGMLAAPGVGGTLRSSALPERVGSFHPGWRGRHPFRCARSSALRGREWLEGKSGLETRIP